MHGDPEDPRPLPIQPPMVYVNEELAWRYKRLARDLKLEEAPTESELDALGAEGWELVGIFADASVAYFYFKRLAD